MKIDVTTADSRSDFLTRLKGSRFPCAARLDAKPSSLCAEAIVPSVAVKFWKGVERSIFEYVKSGGQLYILGGRILRCFFVPEAARGPRNREILQDVFGLEVRSGPSGNVRHALPKALLCTGTTLAEFGRSSCSVEGVLQSLGEPWQQRSHRFSDGCPTIVKKSRKGGSCPCSIP